ncbi:MAG: peroxiredoxin [Thermoplasmata archaeon]
MTVEEGQKAPDFTLPDEENRPVKLSDELGEGPVVLSFYLLDFTGVCTNQACNFRDALGSLKQNGAKVFGISVDSPFSHKKFKEEQSVNYPLLSDFNKEVCRKYGVHYDEIFGLKGVAKRSVFVLDKDGVVRYRWVTEDPGVAPDVNEVARVVKELA